MVVDAALWVERAQAHHSDAFWTVDAPESLRLARNIQMGMMSTAFPRFAKGSDGLPLFNLSLPADIAVQWCQPVDAGFHARNSARGRRYRYLLLESPLRPALGGWARDSPVLPPERYAELVIAGIAIGIHQIGCNA